MAAYYSSEFFNPELGDYYSTPPQYPSDAASTQSIVAYDDAANLSAVSYFQSSYRSDPKFLEYRQSSYATQSDYNEPEYDQTPYGYCYEIAPSQSIVSYDPPPYDGVLNRSVISYSEEHHQSSYLGNTQFATEYPDYDSTPYEYSYKVAPSQSIVAYGLDPYSTSYLSDPKFIDVSYNTQCAIAYSTKPSERYDEELFMQYDPTPYAGGYDIALTYGTALPASNEICYPRSQAAGSTAPLLLDGPANEQDNKSSNPNGVKASDGSIVLAPTAEEEKISDDEEKKSSQDTGTKVEKASLVGNGAKALADSNQDEDKEIVGNYPRSGHCGGFGKIGRSGDYGYDEYEKQVPQIPWGYTSDAMDLCESLFGYWPCFSRKNQKRDGCQEVAFRECEFHRWKATADFLFGSSCYYCGRRIEGRYGDSLYSYERHHPEQPHRMVVEYDEQSSSLQKFRYHEDYYDKS